jgi:serine protease
VGNTDNAQGVAGVNWRVSLMAVRVLGRCGGTTADIADAIRWAVGLSVPGVGTNGNPARVINMSLGGSGTCGSSPAMQSAINDAVAAGATVVVAAGNSASNAANFTPASCDGVITVAASDRKGNLVSRYSNYGETVEILAPGGDVTQGQGGVLSMVKGGYERYNGTSMAAPHVAGVAALLLAEEPGLTPAEVLRRLQANVMPRSDGGCPRPCGAGLLDADLWSDKLRLSPSAFNLKKGQRRNLVATFVRGGVPQAGVTVSFSSNAPNAVQVTASATTGADGRAVATVERQAGGEAVIEARADGLTARAPIKVPAASILGFLLAAAAALYLLGRRREFGG